MKRLLAAALLTALSVSSISVAEAAPKRTAIRARTPERPRTEAEKKAEAERLEADRKAEADRLEAEKKKAEADRLEADKKIEEAKAEQAKAEQAKAEQAKLAAKPSTPVDADASPQTVAIDRPTKIEVMAGGASQGLGFGFGVRGGYTTKSHVYAGVNATLQLTSGSALATYGTGELGYEIKASALKITPTLGAGIMLLIPEKGEVQKSPVVYPSVSVRYDISDTPLSVGVDTRLLYLTDADVTALALAGTMALRF